MVAASIPNTRNQPGKDTSDMKQQRGKLWMGCISYPPPILYLTFTGPPFFHDTSDERKHLNQSEKEWAKEKLLRGERDLKNKLWGISEICSTWIWLRKSLSLKLEKTRITWRLTTFLCCWTLPLPKRLRIKERLCSYKTLSLLHRSDLWLFKL